MTCRNIILFYERHDDKISALTISALSGNLKQAGVKSYCFEEPADNTRASLIEGYKANIDWLDNLISANSFNNPYIQQIAASGLLVIFDKTGKSHKQVTAGSHLSAAEKAQVVKSAHKYGVGMKESIQATLNLVEQTDMEFCAMDIPSQKRARLDSMGASELQTTTVRNKYMAKKIMEQCDERGDVAALVGASHFHIASLLREKGVSVKEYYITDAPVNILSEDLLSEYMHDLCLRTEQKDHKICDNHKFDGLIIDLYAAPDADPAELIARDLATLIQPHDEL